MITVKHGGYTRYSAQLSASQTAAYSAGRLLRLTSGQVLTSAGAQSVVIGIAMEDRKLSTSVGPTTTLTKIGAPAGEQASMILDTAVVENDQIQSGVAIEAGDVLYASTTGYVTTSGNGTGSNNLKIGFALSLGRAGDSARPVTMLFHPEY